MILVSVAMLPRHEMEQVTKVIVQTICLDE